jgi:hypothetical protein
MQYREEVEDEDGKKIKKKNIFAIQSNTTRFKVKEQRKARKALSNAQKQGNESKELKETQEAYPPFLLRHLEAFHIH